MNGFYNGFKDTKAAQLAGAVRRTQYVYCFALVICHVARISHNHNHFGNLLLVLELVSSVIFVTKIKMRTRIIGPFSEN